MGYSVFPPAAAGLQQYEQVFTTSGTWTKPTGVKTVEVTVVGAGGGCTYSSSASGGGGFYRAIADVSTVSSVAVTVGAGQTSNTDGGESSFGSFIACTGGKTVTNINQGGNSGVWYYKSIPGFDVISSIEQKPLSGFPGGRFSQGNSGLWFAPTYALSFSASNTVYKSSDLTLSTWTQVGNLPGSGFTDYPNIQCAAYGNGKWILLNKNDVAATELWVSTDNAATWTTMALPGGMAAYGISFTNNRWFLGGNNAMKTSTDGVTWTDVTVNMPSGGSTYISSVKYGIPSDVGSGMYVAMGGYNSSQRPMYSTDGVTFTQNTGQYIQNLTGDPSYSTEILFKDGRFWAYHTASDQIYTSTSPAGTWSNFSNPVNSNYKTGSLAITAGGLLVWTSAGSYYGVWYARGFAGLQANGWTQVSGFTSYWVRAFTPDPTSGIVQLMAGDQPYRFEMGGFKGQANANAGGGSSVQSGGGGAGGSAYATAANYYIYGPGLEGFAKGGFSPMSSGGAAPGDGTRSGYRSADGIVIVRWWA
jgi:hypothetical protein